MVSLALTAVLLASSPAGAEDKGLESRITPLAKAHKGKVAVAVKNLKTGEEFYLNADEVDADREPHQAADHGRGVLAGGRGEGQARRDADAARKTTRCRAAAS